MHRQNCRNCLVLRFFQYPIKTDVIARIAQYLKIMHIAESEIGNSGEMISMHQRIFLTVIEINQVEPTARDSRFDLDSGLA